ncbi:MAG: SIR2 family protein [bacterium]
MEHANPSDAALAKLAECLATEKPILMVGAGLSKLVDYPLWWELFEELKVALDSPIAKDHEFLVKKLYDRYADELIRLAKRPEDLGPFIRKRFGPQSDSPPFDPDVHLPLLALPFCGVVTTNYDSVLEHAAAAHLAREIPSGIDAGSTEPGRFYCRPTDLCNYNHGTPVFDLLRRFACPGARPCRDEVLHLHGHHDAPDSIILTYSDYLSKYGPLLPDGRTEPSGIVPFHHKVIWSLLVSHPFVFIGFGMEDPYFMKMQEIIRDEFRLGTGYVQVRHFAVMPSNEVTPDLNERLMRSAILPVPYALSEGPEEAGTKYSQGLSDFLCSLGIRLGAVATTLVEQPSEREIEAAGLPQKLDDEVSARDVSKRMLDRR